MALVMKFGGTSVADPKAINQVVGIVRARLAEKPVVITSALAHITNLLLNLPEIAVRGKRNSMKKILREIEARHQVVVESFSKSLRGAVSREIEKLFSELQRKTFRLTKKTAAKKNTSDFFASFGERLSSWLLAGALQNAGIKAQRVDSRDLVVTDSQFGNAEVDFAITKKNFIRIVTPLVRRGIIPVITGFIGRDRKGNTTTLGRGGSDYSAALAALALSANEIQIWKDVKGFLTADPRVVPRAKIIPRISFQEAAELSYFGAKLLHPKTIHPAVEKNIPVRVLNTFSPKDPGTLILGEPKKKRNGLPVRAIAFKKGITVINITSFRIIGIYGFMERLFRVFSLHRVPVDVVATSEAGVSVTIEDKTVTKELIHDLGKVGNVEVRKSHVILSLVGSGLKDDPRVEQHIFEVLEKARISTEMISKGASAINFTCIIKEKDSERAVRMLHNKFFP